MNRAEGVGHIDLSHRGHLTGQLGVVLGLARLKAGVLQQHNLAGLEGGGLGLGVGAHHVPGHDHRLAQQLAETDGDRLQGQLGLHLTLGLAQVRAGDDRRPLVQQVLNGGQGGADALIVGDGSGGLVLGDIKVAAQKHLLAGDVDVLDRLFVVVHGSKTPL